MKNLIFISLVLISTSISADWILGTIFNHTADLVLDKAWNYRSPRKVRTFAALTNMLQKAQTFKRSSVVVQYHVDSRGLAFSGHNAAGHSINLFLDGQPSHSIEWERKKTSTITHFPQWCQSSDGSYCARAIIRDGATGGIIGEPGGNAHDDSAQVFDLYVTGSGGQYKLSLVPA